MSQEQVFGVRNGVTWLILILGLVLSGVALGAEFLGVDITPGFGVFQMVELLFGLALLTLAAFMFVAQLRGPNAPRSLQADIGIRLAATGLIFVFVSGLSDLIGIGTHVTPNFERPFIGPLQLGGIILGVSTILVGLLLYATSRGTLPRSSMDFLLQNKPDEKQED
ncbi:MAG: hypothetical protein Kow0080_27690 [Candidatus Promineifilaceae bacterium]